MLDVCICTHDPDPELLQTVLRAIAAQDVVADGVFQLLLVDNASTPPVDDSVMAAMSDAGIPWRIVREPRPGVSRARSRAIAETGGDWLLFVDDDNELAPDYVRQGLAFIAAEQRIGCFGGKLILAPGLTPEPWAIPFLPYLGIKDFGDETIIGFKDEWGPWEPPTAGAWIRRDVLNAYAHRARSDPRLFGLGRTGRFDLASCEDSLMMRCAFRLGFSSAYRPELRLFHHIAPHRLHFDYLLPLIAAYGRSQVLLESLLGGEYGMCADYRDRARFDGVLDAIFADRRNNARFRAAMMAWHITGRQQTLADDQVKAIA